MTTVPIPITVRRFQCPHCRRTRGKKQAAVEHMGRCWKNPAVRACKTCAHFAPGGDACGCEPGCNWGSSGPDMPSCGVGRELPDDYKPVVHCPLWEARAEESAA